MPYLFLTGPSGVGKSTILKEELAPWGTLVSGFFTQRQLSPSGNTLGFRLLPWEASLPGTVILSPPLRQTLYPAHAPGTNFPTGSF